MFLQYLLAVPVFPPLAADPHLTPGPSVLPLLLLAVVVVIAKTETLGENIQGVGQLQLGVEDLTDLVTATTSTPLLLPL